MALTVGALKRPQPRSRHAAPGAHGAHRSRQGLSGLGALGAGGVSAAPGAARVLVLVKDPDRRARIAKALEGDGHRVLVAASGSGAARLLARNAERPDILVLDMRLPHEDGVAFAEAYRQAPQPHPPIVLATAPGNAGRPGESDPADSPAALNLVRARVRLLARERPPASTSRRHLPRMLTAAAAAVLLVGGALASLASFATPV